MILDTPVIYHPIEHCATVLFSINDECLSLIIKLLHVGTVARSISMTGDAVVAGAGTPAPAYWQRRIFHVAASTPNPQIGWHSDAPS